jgi:hypothetical protein
MHSEDRNAVSLEHLEASLKPAHSGLSPEDISFALKIEIETAQQIISSEPLDKLREVQQLKTQDLHAPQFLEDTLPTFIYNFTSNYQLHRTNLVTGENSIHRLLPHTKEVSSSWSEVP